MTLDAFDYIVVGAGSAGCVMASRLSEHHDVLLIEAGDNDRPDVTFDPVLWVKALRSAVDWGYDTIPQVGLAGREVQAPLGKMLGGTSSLNGMMYQRGHRSDYDSWAHNGAPGWGWDDLTPYFLRVERSLDVEHPLLGSTGAVALEHRGHHEPHPAAMSFMAAAVAHGHRRLDDFESSVGPMGVGHFISNTRNGRRVGAHEAYLANKIGNPRLTIRRATATRLHIEAGRCTGVWVEHAGEQVLIAANLEVVSSAGAVGTPTLLMRSGIGNPEELRTAGIDVVHPLAAVGDNLHDHVMAVLHFHKAKDIPPVEFAADVGLFFQSSPGWIGPDLELIFNPTAFDRQIEGTEPSGITILAALVRPMARGKVGVRSSSVHDAPVIDPNLLGTRSDAERLAYAVREALTLSRDVALAPWIASLDSRDGLDTGATDSDLIAWLRQSAVSQYHLAGSCKMGLDDASVVDPTLKVNGLSGLRVVDASVMPQVVSGHCQAAVLAIAERASDLLLGGL